MAFATNQFVDGEWTTRTVDVNDVLRHYNEQDAQQEIQKVETVPVLGILSQTVLKSPLAHWIIPVKARHFNLNDVAFIGDSFVQIKELRPDGHLWDVIRRDNFGARIRNARVLGSLHAYEKNPPIHGNGPLDTQIKDEDGDINMRHAESKAYPDSQLSEMPPQLIILYLENLDMVFLMLRKTGSGEWKFISSRYRCNEEFIRVYQPGTHLTVDPSSRYVAIGPQEGTFAVLALHPRKELERQYAQGKIPCPVESEGQFLLSGTIHKMEFLYPSANDEDHVILLVLHIFQGRTRMLVYDWMAGDDLRRVKKDVGKGHMLAPARQIPLLLIPLPIKSSFILISEISLAVCKDILIGQPKFEEFPVEEDEPTGLHHGSGRPLWTAWTRPYRFPYFKGDQDCIYIVREDGVIRCLEIHNDDSLIQAEMNIGHIQSNCGTALASLDYHHHGPRTGDYLITGGDSGAGAAYLIKARELPVFQQLIPNWSPASDFVTTSRGQDRKADDSISSGRNTTKHYSKPDKVYACAGKGSSGAILEHRYGLEAHVGLDMEFEAPIENIWVLTPLVSLDDNTGSLLLLSLGARSALLHMSSDVGSVRAVDESETGFDLGSRTITAGMYESSHIQVTEDSIVFIDGEYILKLGKNDVLGVSDGGCLIGYGNQILHAVIYDNNVLFTTKVKGNTYLLQFKPTLPESANNRTEGHEMVQTLASFPSNITCLTTCVQGLERWAIAVVSIEDSTKLLFVRVDGALELEIALPMVTGSLGDPDLGMILNLTTITLNSNALFLLCGTSNGYMVMAEVDTVSSRCLSFTYDQIGLSTAHIRKDEYPGSKNLFYGNCDSKLYAITISHFRIKGSGDRIDRPKRTIHRIYLTDARNSNYTQPDLNSIAKFLPNNLGGIDDSIFITAGSLLIMAGLSLQPKPVPRRIPIGGTPSRLLYSRNFNLLVVAANVKGKNRQEKERSTEKGSGQERSTLLFIDPETGEDVSRPFDMKTNDTVEYITGLGMANDKIFRLTDWTLVKNGKTWNFIILCTSSGRLVLVSAEREERAPPSHTDNMQTRLPRLRYWMRHVFKTGKPIYCVTSFSEGLIYCSGTTLHCDILDLEARKFKPLTEYQLPSPAINVVYEEGGGVYVLTSSHSLEILKLVTSPDGGKVFVRTHGDQVTRTPLHHRILEPSSLDDKSTTLLEPAVHMITDREASVTGLWAISNTKADTLETLFEAQLPYSILKLRYGKCRPLWDSSWTSHAINDMSNLPKSAKYPEVLGISLNGSLSHFTILDHDAWKFMRFLVNLALQSPEYCESLTAMQNPKRHMFEEPVQPKQDASKLEPIPAPHIMMHVDGDILQQCLERQLLEDILQIEATTENAAKIHGSFRALLYTLLRGNAKRPALAVDLKQNPSVRDSSIGGSNGVGDHSSAPGNTDPETMEQMVYQAYKILQHFLRPIL